MKRATVSYPLGPGLNHIAMPVDARVVGAGAENGSLMLYARVYEPGMPASPDPYTRTIMVVETGYEFPDERPWAYAATVPAASWAERQTGASYRPTLHILECAS
jgi:hypothetical protein